MFVTIKGPNGAERRIKAKAVSRIRMAGPGDYGSDQVVSEVDIGPWIGSTESTSDLLAKLKGKGAKFAKFTTPVGTDVFLSAGAVSQITLPNPALDHEKTGSILQVGSDRQAVREAPAEAEKLLEAAIGG